MAKGILSIALMILGICLFAGALKAQDTVTMIQLDPLSGPFKDVGDLSNWVHKWG